MMRNPLDRRMFMNPQQRRGMARMPQGILASGPRIMQAADATGTCANGAWWLSDTGIFGPGTPGFRDLLKSICTWSVTNQIGGSSSTDESVDGSGLLHRVRT